LGYQREWNLLSAIHQTLFATYENLLGCDSADFDGTSDYMTIGGALTGASVSKSGIFSCWVRLDGGNAAALNILAGVTSVGGSTLTFNVLRDTDDTFTILGWTTLLGLILDIQTSATFTASASWIHILSSWNLATSAEHLYVDDVSDITVNTSTDGTIDYDFEDTGIGALASGTNKFNGCLAELYFAPGQFLDLSVTANRRKFISGGKMPMWLGNDGSLPTGTAPIIYQHLARAEAVANFATNRGTGGDFSITGTLETGSTSPSD
jgi:hypothetical protein